MFRVLILLGFIMIFMYFYVIGDILKYINMKYLWILYGMIFLFWFLIIVEFVFYMIGFDEKDQDYDYNCDSGCGYSYELLNKWKRWVWYFFYFLFVVIVFFLFVVIFDLNIVEVKGFYFFIYDKKDFYFLYQFLQSDMSFFYGEDVYDKMIYKDLKKFLKGKIINLEDEEFLNVMEIIY